MPSRTSSTSSPISPSNPLTILIAGGGIAGLCSAISLLNSSPSRYNITIYESASQLSEIGAGIQSYPNASRILERWGVLGDMEAISTPAEVMYIRRWKEGNVLLHSEYDARRLFGSPHWSLHRALWQKVLYEHAISLGAKVLFHQRVKSVNLELGCLEFEDGTSATGDLLVGADGVRSTVREAMLEESGFPFTLGLASQCIYRMLVPEKFMSGDTDLTSLMTEPCNNVWFGPKVACMGYPIMTPDGKRSYNLAVAHEQEATAGRWSDKGDMRMVRKLLGGFEGTMQKVLDKVEESGSDCLKWGLAELPEFGGWSDKRGHAVLLGDAAHAIFPHIGQGAGMTLEDSVVLAECLKRAHTTADIPSLLKTYEALRRPRVDIIRRAARSNMHAWILEDGPEQEARDKIFGAVQKMPQPKTKEALPVMDKDANPNTAAFRSYLFLTDVLTEANNYLDKLELTT